MSLAFNIALQILMVGSLVLFMFSLIYFAHKTENKLERMLRFLALFAGALVALGAQVSGVSYANFTVNALATSRASSAAAHVVGTLIPALMGSAIGFMIWRTMLWQKDKTIRLMCFIGMLASIAFMNIYAQAFSENGVHLGATAIPNISFSTGLILASIFSIETDEKQAKGSGSRIGSVLRNLSSSKTKNGTNSPPNASHSERPGRLFE